MVMSQVHLEDVCLREGLPELLCLTKPKGPKAPSIRGEERSAVMTTQVIGRRRGTAGDSKIRVADR